MSAESYIVSTTKSQPTDASVVDASGDRHLLLCEPKLQKHPLRLWWRDKDCKRIMSTQPTSNWMSSSPDLSLFILRWIGICAKKSPLNLLSSHTVYCPTSLTKCF